jgi:hypothetical protein
MGGSSGNCLAIQRLTGSAGACFSIHRGQEGSPSRRATWALTSQATSTATYI